MVKVWNSAIDNDSNKRAPIKRKRMKSNRGEKDFDDSLDDDDSPMVSRVANEDDEERKIKTMIRLKDFDTTLSIWDIESIDKVSRFVETPRPRWQFGIVINANIEPSMRFPKTDVAAWYEKEELRNSKYERLLVLLEEYGFKILEV